jgi:hypothetical protein
MKILKKKWKKRAKEKGEQALEVETIYFLE